MLLFSSVHGSCKGTSGRKSIKCDYKRPSRRRGGDGDGSGYQNAGQLKEFVLGFYSKIGKCNWQLRIHFKTWRKVFKVSKHKAVANVQEDGDADHPKPLLSCCAHPIIMPSII